MATKTPKKLMTNVGEQPVTGSFAVLLLGSNSYRPSEAIQRYAFLENRTSPYLVA